jgi:hypothetical protein
MTQGGGLRECMGTLVPLSEFQGYDGGVEVVCSSRAAMYR